MEKTKCNLETDIEEAIETGQEFAKSIKKLKSSIAKCSDCEHYEDCKVIQRFQVTIQEIIVSINEEWNIPI